MSELLNGYNSDTGAQEIQPLSKLGIPFNTSTRLSYSPQMRWWLLHKSEEELADINKVEGHGTQLMDFYFPRVNFLNDALGGEPGVRISYSTVAPGIVYPWWEKSRIRDQYAQEITKAIAARNGCGLHELEIQIGAMLRSHCDLVGGQVEVINPITLEKTKISMMNPLDLPPGGLMATINPRNPLDTRRLVGWYANGAYFAAESQYIPENDIEHNVLSGVIFDRLS